MNERFKGKTWNLKLLEENIGSKLFDICLSNVVAMCLLRQRGTKAKINIRDHIKRKSFCTVKETINKMKRPPTEWEKIFASDIVNKGLIFKIYKEVMQLNIKKPNILIRKWAEKLNRHFYKEDMQMVARQRKRCSTSLIIREMQIKATTIYHLTPVIMTIIKKTTNNKCWQGCGKKEPSCTIGGNVNRCSHYGKHYEDSSKN